MSVYLGFFFFLATARRGALRLGWSCLPIHCQFSYCQFDRLKLSANSKERNRWLKMSGKQRISLSKYHKTYFLSHLYLKHFWSDPKNVFRMLCSVTFRKWITLSGDVTWHHEWCYFNVWPLYSPSQCHLNPSYPILNEIQRNNDPRVIAKFVLESSCGKQTDQITYHENNSTTTRHVYQIKVHPTFLCSTLLPHFRHFYTSIFWRRIVSLVEPYCHSCVTATECWSWTWHVWPEVNISSHLND